jgi:dienelactone hydrolase
MDERTVRVRAGDVDLEGDLVVPAGAGGIVLFAHGSGSSRHSPRNRSVARVLQSGGLATLLIDLLTPEEDAIDQRTARLRFDIGLLAGRLVGATEWLAEQPATRDLRIGYFGASTGAGAALVAAAERPNAVHAVVSRGGRPDLAGPALPRVLAPTLLIVGERDRQVIPLNEQALAQLRCVKRLEIVRGATHLFEEPGTLEEAARLAREWFERYLAPASDVAAAVHHQDERAAEGPG